MIMIEEATILQSDVGGVPIFQLYRQQYSGQGAVSEGRIQNEAPKETQY